MSAGIENVRASLAGFMSRRPNEAFRAVPLAQAIGEKDIRRVRQALKLMKEAGDVVTCTVYRGNDPADEEYRLSVAPTGPVAIHNSRQYVPPPASPRAIAARPPAGHQLKTLAGSLSRPRLTREQPASKPASKSAPEAERKAVKVERTDRRRRKASPRQDMLARLIDEAGRPLTGSELLVMVHRTDPDAGHNAVWNALGEMKASGRILPHGKVKAMSPHGPRKQMAWVTPALAARLAETNTKGSDGETTSPERAIPGEAAASAAAPREATTSAPQQTVHSLEHIPQFRPSLVPPAAESPQPAPEAPTSDARARLEVFFKDNFGAWYGFVWLVRVAAGDVAGTMEALAEWQREGRLLYSVADRAPIWHPVEGRW